MPWAGPLFPGHKCSLGYELLDWIHAYCAHGPGDAQGEPLDWDDEIRDFVIDCYELDPFTGRRLVKEAVFSRPKGRAKSEVAGMIAAAEGFGPVRCDGWDADGQPVGRRVVSPLIKCLATEEGQAGNTFQNVSFVAGEWGPDVHPEIYGGVSGVRKYQSASVVYLPDGGEIRACTAGSASKDGGKESFVVPDESHLYVLPELRNMYATVMRNLPKRKAAEPWGLQTTTAYRPGELSVGEETLTAWRKGTLPPSVLVNHREAKGPIRIADREHTLRQLREVYGAAMDPDTGWMIAEEVYDVMIDPRKCPDDATAARYYLNRPMSTIDAWIPKDLVEKLMRPVPLDPNVRLSGEEQLKRGFDASKWVIAPGTAITVGFDGSLNDDTTVLRGCRMTDGFRFRLGAWPKPEGAAGIGWEVPRREVLATIREAYERYDVVRGYFDPHEWRSDIDTLALGDEEAGIRGLGEEKVTPWATSRDTAMGAALDRLHTDMKNGVTLQDDDPLALEHYGNAFIRRKGHLRLVRKEYPNSPRKIDTVPGDALAYEARADALADGWTAEPEEDEIIRPVRLR
jgi:hypothetical protein